MTTTLPPPVKPIILHIRPTVEDVAEEAVIVHRLQHRAPRWVVGLFSTSWVCGSLFYLWQEAHRHIGFAEVLHIGIVPLWLLMGYLFSPERPWMRPTTAKLLRWQPQLLLPYTFTFGDGTVSRTDSYHTIRIPWQEVRSITVTPGGLSLHYGLMSLSRFWVPRSALENTDAQEEIPRFAASHRVRVRQDKTVTAKSWHG